MKRTHLSAGARVTSMEITDVVRALVLGGSRR